VTPRAKPALELVDEDEYLRRLYGFIDEVKEGRR